MTEYAFSVFAICLITGVCGLLSYGSGASEKIVLGIVTLCVIASPLAESVGNFDFNGAGSITFPEINPDRDYADVAEEAFSDGICRAVSEEFSLNREDIRAKISGFDFQNMRAEKIVIYLSGRAAIADYRAVERYINGLEMGECQVEIELGQ